MNNLTHSTCIHAYDMDTPYIANDEIKVCCPLCDYAITYNEAILYNQSLKKHNNSIVGNKQSNFDKEVRELWKSAALAWLTTGESTADHEGKLTSSAAGIADNMISHFKKRVNQGEI